MKELYKFLVWIALALIIFGILILFPSLLEIKPILRYILGFISGMVCTFLSEIIVNKYYKK